MTGAFAHICCAILVCVQLLHAQQLIIRRQDTTQAYPPESRVMSVIENGSMRSTSARTEHDTLRYIVEVAPPAATGSLLLNKTAQTDAALRHSAVRMQLAALGSQVRTLREFTTAMNGFAVATERKNRSRLQALPGVRRVCEDVRLSTYPSALSSTITAMSSPLAPAATGRGIRIGIIDTGIDYLHDALGGGFGSSFKVCGGYDFVNNDADPMDDNGHGTHVAGIIAGDSKTITGIAAGASLYAYKALDATGQGYTSLVIAAIDRAIQDSMKVINLSLGTPNGDPDDLLSQAVDNAASLGIVVVVAAGNGGEFGTIGSPGCARHALTVGAVDAHNVIASFSSKGPTEKNFGLKPDVVAPGVSILSSTMGGGYAPMSGTSMSTPYVAGVAAAIAELHPDWSGNQIRDAIVESALRLPYDCFTAGSGSVDALKAARMQTVTSPGSLSLGFDPSNAASWSKCETLYVVNTTSTPRHYAFTAAAASPAVSIRVEPSVVDAGPYARTMVVAEIEAANGMLTDNRSANEGYTGSITAASALDTISIPFVFFKGTMMHLQFDETPWQVMIHDRNAVQYTFQPKTNSLSTVLPAGTYDVLTAFFPSQYVVRESVQTAGLVELTMNKAEAVHEVRIVATDETGQPVAAGRPHEVYSSLEGLVHRASGFSMISAGGGTYANAQSVGSKYLSTVSSQYVFGCTVNIQDANLTTYTYDTAVDTGITGAVTMAFAAADATPLDVRYDVDTTTTRSLFPIVWSSFYLQGSLVGVTYYDGTAEPLRSPFTQRAFYFKRSSAAFPVFHSREGYKF